MDRGVLMGSYVYHTFQEAKTKIFRFFTDVVIINRYYVKEAECR